MKILAVSLEAVHTHTHTLYLTNKIIKKSIDMNKEKDSDIDL